MKIVVPVKEVAVLDEEFDLLEDRPGVDPDAIEWELNEWDDFSVEAALQLRAVEAEAKEHEGRDREEHHRGDRLQRPQLDAQILGEEGPEGPHAGSPS